MKRFNTTTVCIPSRHYMVNIDERVREIKKLVRAGYYFTINRARQYGKTTTLNELKGALLGEYTVISLSFAGITNEGFETEKAFVRAFCRLFKKNAGLYKEMPEKIREEIDGYIRRTEGALTLDELFITLQEWCAISDKPLVLLIDEIDSATNNQVFLDFLALLRDGYISRDTDGLPAFQSVILAGVTDVKHMKSKIRNEAFSRENSPWNVAADFKIDMSLSQDGIKAMLDEYELDHHTGMDTSQIAAQIRAYTNGYPFLVSRICQLIDEELLPESWTANGVEEAVKALVTEKNTLFDSLMGKIRAYPRLRAQIKYLLFRGEAIEYLPDSDAQDQLMMYGFIVNEQNTVSIANRIFEMRLCRYFVGESEFARDMKREALKDKPEFIKGGALDVPLIME